MTILVFGLVTPQTGDLDALLRLEAQFLSIDYVFSF